MFNPARFIDAPETARMGVGAKASKLGNNASALLTYGNYLTNGPPIGDNYLLDVGTCDISGSHVNCAPPDENGIPEKTGTVCGRQYNSLEERDNLIRELVKVDKDPEGNTIRKCKKFVRINNLPRGKSVNIAGIEVYFNGLLSGATDDLLDLENAPLVTENNQCSVIEANIDDDREDQRDTDIAACEGQGKKYNEDCDSIPNGKCMMIDDRLTCVSMPKPQKKVQWCGPMLDKAKCSGDQATTKCSDNKEIGKAGGGRSKTTDHVKDLFLLILLILLLIIYFFSVNKLNKN